MNDVDRACAAFRTLLEEQQARVAGMTAERADYTNKATVTIGLVDGDGIGPIIMEQAVRVLEGIEDIAICRLTASDVVRHALVQKIVAAYDKFEQERTPASAPRNHPERGKGHGSQDRRHV